MSKPESLEDRRRRIDDLDRRMMEILLERATLVRGIAREKLAGFWLTWPLQAPLSWTIPAEPSPRAGAKA